MNTYRAVWLVVALWLGAAGMALAINVLPAGLLVVTPLFAGGGVVVALLLESEPGRVTSRSRAHSLFEAAFVGGVGAGALAGWVALVGVAGLLLATLVAISSPQALGGWRRALGWLPCPTEAQLEGLARSLACTNPTYVPPPPVSDLALLTHEQLCNAWRDSGTAVRRPATRRSWLRAVEQRGRYLDQLEARQPGFLSAWLSSDAGDPDGLVLQVDTSRAEPPAINWDDLTGGQATDR